MEMWTSDTCANFQYDNNLPIELRSRTGENNCLVCVHSLKVGHGGEVDIAPCGKPVPIPQTSFPTPK